MIKAPRLYGWQLSPVLLSLLFFPLVWWHLGVEWLAGEQDLAHGFPALLAYLFVLTREPFEHKRLTFYEKMFSTAALMALSALYVLAELVNIDLLTYLSLLAALPCLIARLYGCSNALRFWHLHVFFLLPLPLWDSLLEPLVNVASFVSSAFMGLFDLPILIEGNSITTPAGRILIAEGCSGIRYFLVSLIISYLLSILNGYNGWRLITTVVLGAFLGLIANWVRIILLIFVGYFSKMQSSLMSDHESFGWIVFASFCLPALYFAPHRMPDSVSISPALRPHVKTLVTLIALGIMTTAMVLWLRVPNLDQPAPFLFNQKAWLALSKSPAVGVVSPSIPTTYWQHHTLDVKLVAAHNRRQTIDDKLVPFFNQSRVGEHWFLEETKSLAVETKVFQGEVFKSLTTAQRVLSVQMFVVGANITGSFAKAKLLQLPALLTKQNSFWYFLLQTPCVTKDCAMAAEKIQSAFQDVMVFSPSQSVHETEYQYGQYEHLFQKARDM
ncbi:MAG: archaeosortase/exosortase family protein [Gammaproteobacteria bacterium]